MSENILIELKGLTKRYGYGDTESFALKDFDLTIKRIQVFDPVGVQSDSADLGIVDGCSIFERLVGVVIRKRSVKAVT